MKLFLIWADASEELSAMMRELEKNKHEIIYWVGYVGGEKYKLPKTIFHSYADAMAVKPAPGVDVSNFMPPGKALVDQLHEMESVILTMMNRLPGFSDLKVDERKHTYYNMLQYWLGVFNRYKPDMVIFPNMPHFVYDFVIYKLAHFLGIRTLFFDETRIQGRLLLFEDLDKGNESLLQELKKNRGRTFSLNDLSEDIQKYCHSRMTKSYKATPEYILEMQKKYSFSKNLAARFISEPKVRKSIKDLTFFYKAPRYFYKTVRDNGFNILKKICNRIWTNITINLKKEYAKVQTVPDLSKPFVYVPLHAQPERATSPQGGVFVDQILMLEILSSALPMGWIIYVKEHPMQWLSNGINFSDARYQNYYKQISKIKNIYLVSVKANSYDLIRQSKLIATVTGAAAWESALQLRPSIIFGRVWYENCPGILRVHDVDSCREAIKKITDGFKITEDEIINYLRCFDNVATRGFISNIVGKVAGMGREESTRNMTRLILQKIESLKQPL